MTILKTALSFCFLLGFYLQINGQRAVLDISSDWAFRRITDTGFIPVNLPHTYNALDAFDDEPGYFRGKVIYQKVFTGLEKATGFRHFIKFYGVNQTARVEVNGRLAGEHKGGYTAFLIELTDQLTYSSDTLTVRVDNSHDESIPPLKGDFTFYGGIYRKVEWITLPATHFDPDVYGANGLFIDPLDISVEKAKVRLRAHLVNFDPKQHEWLVSVVDPKGNRMGKWNSWQKSEPEDSYQMELVIRDPNLWSVEVPQRYLFRCSLVEKESGRVLDQLDIPYGFRFYRFDPDEGFFLNDRHVKLIGVNRHQDRPGIGNALSPVHHASDMDLIREMGANFLRTAHYPQDPLITEYCDREGILVSMEIPLDHEISYHPEFAPNCRYMILEMIHQYYNHPSVIIWAYMNEMGLWKDAVKDRQLMIDITTLAADLDQLIRKEDPYRYTMIPNHGYFDIYEEFGMTEIPMIVGWNLYFGWYVPDMEGFGTFADRAHERVPHKPMLITEYGAGADPRISSFKPQRFDFSVNWELDFHRAHLRQILERPYIAGSAVWNMFDFGSESRIDAVPHVNNKGLCTFDRQPKAPYFVYQQYLRKDLTVDIPQPQPQVVLADETSRMHLPEWYTGKILTPDDWWDQYSIVSINFGTDFYFQEDGITWLPDAGLPSSFYTCKGGTRAVVRNYGIGTDKPIALTPIDPVYQTWMEGPEEIRVKLPDGTYRFILHFSCNQEVACEGIWLDSGNGPAWQSAPLEPFRAWRTEYEQWVDGTWVLRFGGGSEKSFINGLQIIRL